MAFEASSNLDAGAMLRPAPRMQRANGSGQLTVRHAAGATRLGRLFQEGSAQIRVLNVAGAPVCDAVLINTAGGLAGGDRFDWAVTVEAGARCRVITQACEKVYRTAGAPARVSVSLSVAAGARLDWIPQETILFDNAGLGRRLDLDLAANAAALVVEAVILGRTAMGETVRQGDFHDRWRVRRDGRLVFADDLRLQGPVAEITRGPATLAQGRAFATLALFTDAPRPVDPLRALVGPAGGVSAFDGKLICRMVAPDGAALRRMLIPALTLLGDGVPPPRVWTN